MGEPHSVSGFYRNYGKRVIDLVLAVGALLIAGPVLLVLALVSSRKIGRPVFFSQERAGLDGKCFRIIKFRTMTNTSDAQGCLLPDEERLGPWGKFLRSTSLDELPELI